MSKQKQKLKRGKKKKIGRDPNMDFALKWAENVCPLKDLVNYPVYNPKMLIEPDETAKVVHEIDGPLVGQSILSKVSPEEKKRRESKIAEIACGMIPGMPLPPYQIVSCFLRIWSGCLSCAKTIADKTRSGPNTPRHRREVFTEKINKIADRDPYYFLGVMCGPGLRDIRKQPWSTEGVPQELIQKFKIYHVYG